MYYGWNYKKTAFGFADRLSDYYKSLAIGIGVVFLSLMFLLYPDKWIIWLIVFPFVAWIGPIALLIPIAILEAIVYGIVFPKKVFNKSFSTVCWW